MTADDRSESRAQEKEKAVDAPAVWRGLTPGFLSVIAWLLGGALAAGLSLFVARLVGTPLSSAAAAGSLSTGSRPVVVPAPFMWAAAAIVPVAVLAVATGAFTYLWQISRGSEADLRTVRKAFPLTSDMDPKAYDKRVRWIAKTWHSRNTLLTGSVTPVEVFVVGTGGIVLAGSVVYLTDPAWVTRVAGWLVGLGVGLMAAVMLWLLQLVRKVYEDPGTRRQVGIIWDLGTFWPRAVHPLAPPCYAERAIPDLIRRIDYHAGIPECPADPATAPTDETPQERPVAPAGDPHEGRPVVLSCHSQGSVIGAATVLQLTYEASSRVALLTYGNPVRRLYSRFFPAYFDLDTVTRIGSLLGDPKQVQRKPGQAGPIAGAQGRATWRWRNLYRPTDPIGGPMFIDAPLGPPHDGGEVWHDVDWNLKDPVAAGPLPGDTCCPPALGHSDYFVDTEFDNADDQLKDALTRQWSPPAPSENVR